MASLNLLVRHIRNLAGEDPFSSCEDGVLLRAFASRHEEAAFATLLGRHGPMVLSVARRLLHNEHDAEDVFQAAFLLLARKAGVIRRQESVGSWLHGVTLRLALKARSQNLHRHTRERQAAQMRPKSANLEAAWRQLHELLDQTLQKLPEKYRTVLLLCYLEGRTQEEVAKQLGCPLGTVRSRLAQGRKLLRDRLAKQGFTSTAGALTALLVANTASSAIEATLYRQTLTSALFLAAGKSTAHVVSSGAAKLFSAGMRSLAVTKIKIATITMLAGGLCLGTAGALAYPLLTGLLDPARPAVSPNADHGSDEPPQKATALKAHEEAEEKTELSISGQVVDARGKPVAGAQVALIAKDHGARRGGDLSARDAPIRPRTKTDAEGRFRLSVKRTPTTRLSNVAIIALASQHGLGMQQLNLEASRSDALIKLPDEHEIRGRLVDLKGQPAIGVQVHVCSVGKGETGIPSPLSFWDPSGENLQLPGPVTTDAEGRFVLRQLNRTQGVAVQVRDDRFARAIFSIPEQPKETEVTFSMAPAQAIEGRILAADTLKPIPNAHFTVYASDRDDDLFLGSGIGMDGDADSQGRFRAIPFAGKAFTVTAYAPDGEPYLTTMKGFKWPKGEVKHQFDLRLPRGVLVRGRVIEEGTSKPIARAMVQYVPRRDNTNQRSEIVTQWQGAVSSGPDGVFHIVVIPGKGHLLVRAEPPDFVPKETSSGQLDGGGPNGSRLYPHGLLSLDLKPDQQPKEITVALRRGVTVRGRVVGPDGEPVGKCVMLHRLDGIGESIWWRHAVDVLDGQFEIRGLDPSQTIPVYFLEAKKQWGACVQVSGKDVGKSLTVRLEPCGRAIARYVDADARPVANHLPTLYVAVTPGRLRFGLGPGLWADEDFINNIDRHNYWDGPRTDKEGRVTLPALIPGATYHIARFQDGWKLHKEFSVKSGETINLGDIATPNTN
jgi:RNA polymerase sigma factor (sigma-70 family)